MCRACNFVMDSRNLLIYGVLAMLLVTHTFAQVQGQLNDERAIPSTASSHFQLIITPAEVIRDVTRDIRINCALTRKGTSGLKQIDRVRLLKKSTTGWQQLAETRWYNMSVKKRHRLTPGRKWVLLKFNWIAARDDIFGIYRCDLVGSDKATKLVTESSAEVELGSVDLTAFLIKMKSDHYREISHLKKKISSLEQQLLTQGKEIDSVKEDLVTVKANVTDEIAHLSVGDIHGAVSDQAFLQLKTDFNSANIKLQNTQKDVTRSRSELSSLNASFRDELDQFRGDIKSLTTQSAPQCFNLTVSNVLGAASEESVKAIFKRVESLGESIIAYQQNLTSLAELVNNDIFFMKKEFAHVKNNVSFSCNNMSDLHRNVTQNAEDVINLRDDFRSLKEHTASLEKGDASQNLNLLDLSDRVDKADGNVKSLRTQIKSLQNMLKSLGGNISSNSGKISELHRDMSTSNDKCKSLNEDMSSLSSQVSSLETNSGKLTQEMSTLKQEVKSVKQDIFFADGRLETITNDISGLQEDMSAKDAELETIRADIASNKYMSSSSKKASEGLSGEVSTLKRDFYRIEQDVTLQDTGKSATHRNMVSLHKSLSSKRDPRSSNLEAVNHQVALFEKEINSLKNGVNDVRNRLTSLEINSNLPHPKHRQHFWS